MKIHVVFRNELYKEKILLKAFSSRNSADKYVQMLEVEIPTHLKYRFWFTIVQIEVEE
jgi:hypothetical protein